MSIKFDDLRQKIIDELNIRKTKLQINEPVTLIDGFVNQPIQSELTGAFVVWWPTIPMIMLIGNESWKIYFFALKALLPNESI